MTHSPRKPSDESREQAMRDEMEFHVEMEADELHRMGVPADEAKRRALASFGGMRRYAEEANDERRGNWRDDLRRDLRYSLRSLRRTPGYTFVVVFTLALAIAANTSIFSVANSVLFKRLPYRDPSRLMVLWDGLDWVGVPEAWTTGPEVVRLRKELTSFEGFSAVRGSSATLAGDQSAEPQQIPQTSVSANFFQILGVGPELGRGFAKGDDAPGAARVAVISHRLFSQRFSGDRSLVGQSVVLDGAPTTIIGVLASDFRYAPQSSLASPSPDADIYVPLTDTLERYSHGTHTVNVLARIRGDVSVSAALAELSRLSSRLDKEDYGTRGFKFVPIIFQERLVREVRPALLALLGAVATLVLIMCANLAVLALVRAARREHELTVRRAIGASQGRMARQILTETLVLSFGGAIVGSVLGVWALRALLIIAPAGMPRRDEIGIDLIVLGATSIIALLVGFGMGLAPVLRMARTDIASVLHEKSPSHAGSRIRSALVLAQLALSVMLLSGTGLLLGSFVRLMRVDPGFDPNHVLTVPLLASRSTYASGAPVVDVYSRYVAAIRAVPGVASVAATGAPPLSASADQSGVRFPSSPTNTGDPQHDNLLADNTPITAGYLQTMGVELLAGREFDGSETDTTLAKVAVIDELLAKRYFPKTSAVGQTVLIDGSPLRVVGVARHFRMYNYEGVGREQLWIPHMLTPYRGMVLVVRASGDPLALTDAIRKAIHSVDPQQAVSRVETMDEIVRASFAQRRLVLTLVGLFAGAALLLVALGVYGITASTVAQRTRELGIRVALGADARRVIGTVIGQPTRLIAAGLLLGLAGTWLVGRFARGLLYDVAPTDPLTLVSVSFVLLGVGVVAGYVPARRATRVDPMVALRSE
jgi:putative ABC transport system permease protein